MSPNTCSFTFHLPSGHIPTEYFVDVTTTTVQRCGRGWRRVWQTQTLKLVWNCQFVDVSVHLPKGAICHAKWHYLPIRSRFHGPSSPSSRQQREWPQQNGNLACGIATYPPLQGLFRPTWRGTAAERSVTAWNFDFQMVEGSSSSSSSSTVWGQRPSPLCQEKGNSAQRDLINLWPLNGS